MTTLSLCLFLAAVYPPAVPIDSPMTAPQQLRAMRLAQPITIDGLMLEPMWRSAERISAFLQRDPKEGEAATESTVVYIAYDDAALYIAARLYDSHPDSIVARLARRDQGTNSDRFTVYIDPYHDKRSGFYFGITAAGTLHDGTLLNDDWDDDSWDGVWDGKVSRDSLGWIAELRIPYSQLRFVKQTQYVWGINFRRDIARRNEFDFIVYTPKNGSGFVSRFPDLVGIERIEPPRRLEVMPYVTTRAAFTPHAAGDPFNDGSQLTPGMGADARIGLGSNLTLNATVNPDFGQVEVDPAVVNLSDVETFFSEKRPFFVDGSSVFDFGSGGARNSWSFNWPRPNFFYSRRIGRSLGAGAPPGGYADGPDGAHILGALKLTGKVAGSWNVGGLTAVTARERATFVDSLNNRWTQEIEPLAGYGVYRAQKEFDKGRQGLGFISTVAMRSFEDAGLRDAQLQLAARRGRRLDIPRFEQDLGLHRLDQRIPDLRLASPHDGGATELYALLPAARWGQRRRHRGDLVGRGLGPDHAQQATREHVRELVVRIHLAGVRRERPWVPLAHRHHQHARGRRQDLEQTWEDLPLRRGGRRRIPEL